MNKAFETKYQGPCRGALVVTIPVGQFLTMALDCLKKSHPGGPRREPQPCDKKVALVYSENPVSLFQ